MSTRILILKDGVITPSRSSNDITAINTALGITDALALKANLLSPNLAGTPTAPTATSGTNTTQIATTAFVTTATSNFVDLTTAQTITGLKTFNGGLQLSSTAGTSVGTIWRNVDNLEYKDSANVTKILLNSAGNLSNLINKQTALNNLVQNQTANRVLRSNGVNVVLAQVGLTTDVVDVLPIANGGTGSSTQNFVGLTGIQTIAGTKTFSNALRVSSGTGAIQLQPGTSTNAGFLELFKSDGTTRIGYIGFDNTNISYTVEGGASHTFSGGVVRNTNTTASTSTSTGASIISGGQAIVGNQYIGGFSSLGDNVAIKAKRITGTTAATQGANVILSPGITLDKIVGIQCLVNYTAGGYMVPNHTFFTGYQYDVYLDGGGIVVLNTNNSANILSKPITIFILYTA